MTQKAPWGARILMSGHQAYSAVLKYCANLRSVNLEHRNPPPTKKKMGGKL